jgi:hypothetical protein
MTPNEPQFDIRAWVAQSRANQGLPPHGVTDPSALEKLATLLAVRPAKAATK